MRMVKAHDERLNEFLDAAASIMARKGYEKTTIQEIIDAVGVSKGAFYHYFSSKEELLDALAEKSADAALERISEAIGREDMRADDKLRAFLGATWQWKSENLEFVAVLASVFAEENVRLRNRIIQKSKALNESILLGIVEQGIGEGVFQVKYPRETVELYIQLMVAASDSWIRIMTSDAGAAEKSRRAKRTFAVVLEMLEKMLGMPEGSAGRVPDRYIRKLLKMDLGAMDLVTFPAGGAPGSRDNPAVDSSLPPERREAR